MTEYAIVPATSEHARELAMTMRQADRDEAFAQTGQHPALALGMTVGSSVAAWTGLVDGVVACMFGVTGNEGEEVGHPWMIGSRLIVKHQRAFLRRNRAVVEEMQSLFPVLENYVDERNSIAIRWLKWLGFDIFETEPHGPYKLPFHRFRRVRG